MYYYTKRNIMKRNIFLIIIIAAFMSSCATTARIDKNFSVKPPYKTEKSLTLERLAKDERDHWSLERGNNRWSDEIGRNTFTVFGIPTFRLYSRTRLENQMMVNVKETLDDAGFNITYNQYPRLEVVIDDFYFYNYTWLFPFYLFWGKMALSMNLKNEEEQVIWSEKVGGASFLPGFFSFNPVIRRSMRKTLRDLQKACLREDFLEHLSGE